MKKQVGRIVKRVGAVLLSVAVIMSSTANSSVSYAAQMQEVTTVAKEVNETEKTSEGMTETKTTVESGITEIESLGKETTDDEVQREEEIATEETTKVETVETEETTKVETIETEETSEVKAESETVIESKTETEEIIEQISLMSLAVASEETLINADGTGYFVDCGYGRLTTGQTSAAFVEKREAHTYINAVADVEYTVESGWGYVADSIAGTKSYVDGIGVYATGYYGDKSSKDVIYYVTLDEGDYTFTSGHYEWWDTSSRKTDVVVSYEGETGNYEKLIGTASFTGTKGQNTIITGEFSVDADDTLVKLTFAKNNSSVEAGSVAYFEILPVEKPAEPEQKPVGQGGLIAHYTFADVEGAISNNTQIKDISGKENHATLYGEGASAQNGELSLPGGASDSSAAYVQLPTGMFDARETLTISVWLQNKTGAGNYCAMSFGTEKNSHGYPTNYWLLNPCNPDGYFKSVITDGNDSGGPWNSETRTSTARTSAEWGMYTTVITPERITGYYNGVEVCTDTKQITIAEFGENLLAYIGKSSYSDQFYAGKVKDVRVYTEALSAEEIMKLYEDEITPDVPENDQPQEGKLIAQYTFADLSGNVSNGTKVEDISGNGNHATICGDGASVTKGALRLPGGGNGSSAAYVQLPTGMFDAQETLTISVWMQNLTGAGNYAGMYFGTDKNSSGNPANYWLLNPCNPSGYFKSVVTDGTNESKPWETETSVSATKTSNGWSLYTTIITPNSITGYYNGKQVSSAAKDIKIADFGENLLAFIGKSPYPDHLYKGQVKDVRVYTKALSAKEIADMYNAEFPSLPTSDVKATKVETSLPTDEVISMEAGESLDATAKITLNDGSVVDGYISWDKDIESLEPGEYTVNGVVDYWPYPLIEERADPQIYQDTENDCYYFTSSWPAYGSKESGYNKIVIRKADTIPELATAEDITIWNAHTSGEQMYHIWAPELHKIGGDWYIYYAAGTASNGWGINCFVLKCDGDKDITKAENWTELGYFLDENGNKFTHMCLDMTFFEANGKSYVIWADKDLSTNISDLKMGPIDPANPCKLTGKAITLSTPEYDWEFVREKVNEGPAVFIRDGKVYVTFSASATGVEYCVGLLWANVSDNLMDVENWNKCKSPVLSTSDTAGEYGPGHNSFTVDEDGNLLMIYHARDEECYQKKCAYANGDSLYDPCRNALVKYVRFTEDGFPIFNSSATKELGDMRNITVTINVGNITATDKVQADLDGITLYNLDDVRGNMTLPSVGEVYGNKITWTSSDEKIISKTGVVSRPETTKKVTLTATVTDAKDENVKVTKDFVATVVEKAEVADFEAYLFAYFTGEGTANGEQIYFATSKDGLNWEALNDGAPVITSELGEKGLRDPFIIRSPEGDKFYLIATDLRIYNGNGWGAAQESGSRSIMIWESTDLVNWSEQRMVEVATEGAGCTWAPEAFYNDATGEYMVFWSSKIPSTYQVDNNDYTHRVYYATTRDFYTFSEPQVWIELHNPSGNAISVIDATVVKVGDTYYRFTKNEATEAHKTGCPAGKYTILETSKSLLGEWTEIASAINNTTGVEGATCFKFNGEDKWCLLLDNHGGGGYYPLVTDDLSSGNFTKLDKKEYSFPSTMRHGTVIPLTKEEYERLCPPTSVERVDDADDSLTYSGNFTHKDDAGSDYYRRTLSTGVAEEWTKISHTSTTTESGTLNKFYYQTADGAAWSYNSDNAWAGTAGEYYELTFFGTDIDLYGYCNPSNGSGTVYIDGEKAGILNCNSSNWETKVVFSKTGLASGKHTVKVVVDKDGGYVSAAGAKVCDKKDVETSVSGSFTGTGFTVIGSGSDGSFAIYVDGEYVETQTDAVAVKNLTDKKHTYKIVVKEGTLCVDAIEYLMTYNGEEPVDYELEDAIYQLKQLVSKYALTDKEKESYSPSSLEKFQEAYHYAKKVSEGWGDQTLDRIRSYTSKLEKKYHGLQAKGTPVTYTSFSGTNGEVWYDTDGTEIQAHGGQILPVTQADGSVIYYWYGEDKTDGYRTVDGGVRVYSSTDLYNWKSEGIAMRNLTDKYDFEEDYFKELYAGYTDAQKDAVLLGINDTTSVIERPKVIYNEKNDKYIMWFHADGPTETSTANYAAASAGVAVSDSPTGPFRYIDRYRLHYVNGAHDSSKGMARDMNLFVDDDGKAYIIYSSEENQTMFISLLDEDYTALAVDADTAAKIYDETKEMSGFNRIPCYVKVAREAPALFKYDGAYYLITSGCTGWGANPAAYAICKGESPLDAWTDMGNPCVSDTSICKYGANLTFGSQSTSVLAVNAEKGEYIYMGDRWNNSSPAGNELIDPKYIWLPIQFTTNGEIIIYPKNDWTLDDLGVIQYAVEPAEELDAYVAVDGLKSLPSKMDFIFEEETVTSRVNWEVVSGDINYAGSLVTVKGTLLDFKEGKTSVERELFVASEDLLYLIDCGMTADNGYTSELYQLAAEKANLLNDVSDAVFDEAKGWGYDSNSIKGTKGFEASCGSLRELGYYGGDGKNVTYYVTLDAGEYDLVSGHYEWWNTSRRHTDVIVSYEKKDDTIYKQLVGTSVFGGSKGEQGQIYGTFTVEEDDTLVTITFAKASSSIEDGTVAYFGIAKHYEAPAQNDKPSSGTTPGSGSSNNQNSTGSSSSNASNNSISSSQPSTSTQSTKADTTVAEQKVPLAVIPQVDIPVVEKPVTKPNATTSKEVAKSEIVGEEIVEEVEATTEVDVTIEEQETPLVDKIEETPVKEEAPITSDDAKDNAEKEVQLTTPTASKQNSPGLAFALAAIGALVVVAAGTILVLRKRNQIEE